MKKTRTERDILGEMQVPAEAYWGISTERAIKNFQISGQTMPEDFIRALVTVKKACAVANMEIGRLDTSLGAAIVTAADEILVERKYLDQFPVDVYQTGSGTQTNMNANEVLANRANEILGKPKGLKAPVHPNDHVNLSQSSNDVIPTAMHLAALEALDRELAPSLELLIRTLEAKVGEFEGIVKIARTHLQDAVPIPLSTEFSVYRNQMAAAAVDIGAARAGLLSIPLGGTAVGTGVNAGKRFTDSVVSHLSRITGFQFRTNPVMAEGIASHGSVVRLSGAIRGLGLACLKMANDIRWMGSGPRAGLGELLLPENEPGSSIMPGKVNPTQSEALIQVCLRVMGNDETISLAEANGSVLDLNIAKPLLTVTLLESIRILANGIRSFVTNCLEGIEPNLQRIEKQLDESLMVVTRLAPRFGYDKAAEVARKANQSGKTIRQTLIEMDIPIDEEMNRLLDPKEMAQQPP